MKFEEKKIRGHSKYFIDSKEVSKKAYDTLKAEYDVEESDDCPFCSLARDIVNDLDEIEEYEDRVELLHGVLSNINKIGYTLALRNEAESLMDIADQIEEGEEQEYED